MKVPQKIFSNSYVGELYNLTQTEEDIKRYIVDKFVYESKYPKGSPVIDVEEIKLKIPDEESNYDIDNSIIIHNTFSKLTETQATDHRLWTYLTHVTFWDYMRHRWPVTIVDGDLKKASEYIRTHYFIPTVNTRSFLRNGISRLWWYAHLTFDEALSDKYLLTKVLLSDLDRTAAILERNLGRNKKILFAFLEVLSEIPTLGREDVRRLARHLNLTAGVVVLPILTKEKIKELIYKKISDLVSAQ